MKTITIKADSMYEVNKELSKLEKEYKVVKVLSSTTINKKEIVKVRVYNSKPPFNY